jgi:hypothetical protein
MTDQAPLDPNSPEFQALVDENRRRRDEVLGSILPTTGGIIADRSEAEALDEIAAATVVVDEELPHFMQSWPTWLTWPYLALGLLGPVSLCAGLVVLLWGAHPGIALGDLAFGVMCTPLWVLANGQAWRQDHPETRNRLAQAAYRFGVRSWMSGRFTWASAIGLVVVLIGVVAAFLLFPPADRTSGLDGGVEAVLASVSGIGVFVVLAIVWGWYGVFLPRRERCEHDARMVEASAPRDPAVAARAAELHSKIDDLRRRETLAATSAERKLLHAQRIDLERVYLGMSQSQAD